MDLENFLKSIRSCKKHNPQDKQSSGYTSVDIGLNRMFNAWEIVEFNQAYDDGFCGAHSTKSYFFHKDSFAPVLEELREKGCVEINCSAVHLMSNDKYNNHGGCSGYEWEGKIFRAKLGGRIKITDSKIDISELVCEIEKQLAEESVYENPLEKKFRDLIGWEISGLAPQLCHKP